MTTFTFVSLAEDQLSHINSKIRKCSPIKIKRDVADAVYTWELCRLQNCERIKLWIKHIVMYEFEDQENCIDITSIKDHSNYDSVSTYYRKCELEVEELKIDRMCGNFTLHDFLTKRDLLDISLTPQEYFRACKYRYENVNPKKYPIYQDFIFDKIASKFLQLSGIEDSCWRTAYRLEWDETFQGKTIMLKLGDQSRLTIIDNDTLVSKVSILEHSPLKWENLKTYYVCCAKLLIRDVLLVYYDATNLDHERIIDLNRYKDLTCYPFLAIYVERCLSELQAMRRDKVSRSVTLYRCLMQKDAKAIKFATNASRDERLYERVLSGKYLLNQGVIGNEITRSFLIDLLVYKCTFIESYKDYSKNMAGSVYSRKPVLYPGVTHLIAEHLTHSDLLNFVLALSVSYKEPKKPRSSKKRKHDIPVERLTRSKRLLK